MKQEEPGAIADLVKKTVASSRSAARIRDVDVGIDSEAKDFVRILISFDNLKDLSDDDLDAITSSIEGAMFELDDRFPSVRYLEP